MKVQYVNSTKTVSTQIEVLKGSEKIARYPGPKVKDESHRCSLGVFSRKQSFKLNGSVG